MNDKAYHYVTFGQAHTHTINGKVLDANCVAVVKGGRARAEELFGTKFATSYDKEPKADVMKFFVDGLVYVDE